MLTMPSDFKPQIQWRSLDALIPYVNNAKSHPQSQIDRIAASIVEFGFTVPVVVDGKGVLIAGHGRLLAARKLCLVGVPVSVRDDLTPAQVKALRLADNRLAESSWDNDALRLELELLTELNFNLELTGFNLDDLAELCDVPEEISDVETATESEQDQDNRSIQCPRCGEQFTPKGEQ